VWGSTTTGLRVVVPHCGDKLASLQGFLYVPFFRLSRERLALYQGPAEWRSQRESLDPAAQATYDPGASIITFL
jgi:hypothetical protein